MFEYKAKLLRVVDGDTVHLEVDLGFDVVRRDSFRLAGIDAPERGTPEGRAATAWISGMIDQCVDGMVLRTVKDRREKYGRYLATIMLAEVNLNQAMIDAGHARPYDGGPR